MACYGLCWARAYQPSMAQGWMSMRLDSSQGGCHCHGESKYPGYLHLTTLQCIHFSCFHDNLCGTGVSASMQPAIGIHTSCRPFQSRYVDVLLNGLQEWEQSSDPHSAVSPWFSRAFPAFQIELSTSRRKHVVMNSLLPSG